MEIHRQVNELNLDWIFNCINRGKINSRIGGSVTHKLTLSSIYSKGREKGRS